MLYDWLYAIVPNMSIMRLLKSKESVETFSSKTFVDYIMDDDSTETDALDYFLHKAYGRAILAKKQLERKMHNIVLNAFIIDRKEGKIVNNIEQAISNVNDYKKLLFKDIQKYFKIIDPTSEISTLDVDSVSLDNLLRLYKKDISRRL
jgi:hypothetical protein